MTALARLILGQAKRSRLSSFEKGFESVFSFSPDPIDYKAMIRHRRVDLDAPILSGIEIDGANLRGDFQRAMGKIRGRKATLANG